MRATVQIPICDLRVIQGGDTGRLRTPHWPHARVGLLRNGQSEFLRYCGALRDTPCQDTGGWSGRTQYASIGNAVRFDEAYTRSIRRHLARLSLLDHHCYTPDRPYLENQARWIFAHCSAPRAFVQLVFTISSPRRPLSKPQVAGVVEGLMDIKLKIPRLQWSGSLAHLGAAVGDLFHLATTRVSYTGPSARRLVRTGVPLVVLEATEYEIVGAPDDYVKCSSALAKATYFRQASASPPREVWILDEPARSPGRPDLHIARFHSERSSLVELFRAYQGGLLADNSAFGPVNQLALQHALEDSTRFLKKRTAFGRDQSELRNALLTEFEVAGPVWESLVGFAESVSSSIGHNVVEIFGGDKIMGDNIGGDKIEGDKVGGDKVGGDKVGDITDSVFVNRSVVDSLGKLSRSEEDLVSDLKALGGVIDEHGSSDAKELYAELVKEVAGERRRSLVRTLWNGIVAILPSASAVLGSAAALAALLG